jgi:NADH-quinone oxidoreductase subunit A
MTPTSIVAYLVLFTAVGALFVLATLLLGRFLRARAPRAEKLEIYECGEPTIGSSFVQFDLRFYVVALLFIVFDVEAAFFFPWAVVFGQAIKLADPHRPAVVAAAPDGPSPEVTLTPAAQASLGDLGLAKPMPPDPSGKTSAEAQGQVVHETGRRLALTAIADMGVFFGVLLVGFAYIWKKGDLDWVRALEQEVAAEEAGNLAGTGTN